MVLARCISRSETDSEHIFENKSRVKKNGSPKTLVLNDNLSEGVVVCMEFLGVSTVFKVQHVLLNVLSTFMKTKVKKEPWASGGQQK